MSSILIYSRADERFPRRLVLATDGLQSTVAAAQVAADICCRNGFELHVAYVEPSVLGHNPSLTIISSFISSIEAAGETYEQNLQDALEVLHAGVKQVEEAGGGVTKTHLRVGRPAQEIVSLSKELEADLVVVGRRRWGRLRRMIVGNL